MASNQRPTMTAAERRALIDKPFPVVRVQPRLWAGVNVGDTWDAMFQRIAEGKQQLGYLSSYENALTPDVMTEAYNTLGMLEAEELVSMTLVDSLDLEMEGDNE